jgi:hypothetical protein
MITRADPGVIVSLVIGKSREAVAGRCRLGGMSYLVIPVYSVGIMIVLQPWIFIIKIQKRNYLISAQR